MIIMMQIKEKNENPDDKYDFNEQFNHKDFINKYF